jgi:hypothetical protein
MKEIFRQVNPIKLGFKKRTGLQNNNFLLDIPSQIPIFYIRVISVRLKINIKFTSHIS